MSKEVSEKQGEPKTGDDRVQNPMVKSLMNP